MTCLVSGSHSSSAGTRCRARTRPTVEAGRPGWCPIQTGPRRESVRATRIRASTQAGVRCGWVRATLGRSTSAARPSTWKRRHHRHAAVRETPISAATCAAGLPAEIRETSVNLPAGVSRAFARDARDPRWSKRVPPAVPTRPGGLSLRQQRSWSVQLGSGKPSDSTDRSPMPLVIEAQPISDTLYRLEITMDGTAIGEYERSRHADVARKIEEVNCAADYLMELYSRRGMFVVRWDSATRSKVIRDESGNHIGEIPGPAGEDPLAKPNDPSRRRSRSARRRSRAGCGEGD